MSYKLSQAAMHSSAKGTAQHVLIHLAEVVANDAVKEESSSGKVIFTAECFPGLDYLSRMTGYSESTIRRARQGLRKQGYISYKVVHGQKIKYTLHVPKWEHNQDEHGAQNGTPKGSQNERCREVKMSTIKENSKIEEIKDTLKTDKTKGEGVVVGCGTTTSDEEFIKQTVYGKLVDEGMSREEADNRIQAVWGEYKALEKAKQVEGYSGIRNKLQYLIGALYNMAKEGPKAGATSTTGKPEPRDLEGILAELREVFRAIYPKQAKHIDEIVSVDELPDNLINKVHAWEDSGWVKTVSPVGRVRSLIEGYVAGRIRDAIEDDKEQSGRDLVRWRWRRAERQAELKEAEKEGRSNASKEYIRERIRLLDEQIKKTEARINAA